MKEKGSIFMKTLKENLNGILLSLFEIVTGILLLANPAAFTSGIIVACGILLLIVGIISVIKYFRLSAEDGAKSQFLLKGLAALLIGSFLTAQYQWLMITFPLLTVLYGVGILFTGLAKVQWAVDMIRLKRGRWVLPAVSAIISIVCAAIIISSPFSSTAVLWMFTGISLIVEAVFDVIALFIGGKTDKGTETSEYVGE